MGVCSLARQMRRKDNSGPPPKEQTLNFKIRGLEESDANKILMEVVFQERSQRPPMTLLLAHYDKDEQVAAWSLAVATAELIPGIHFFYFKVNGVSVVSTEHMRLGRWNALHVSDPIRRYLLARDSKGQLSEDAPIVEKTRSKKIVDMAMDSCVGSGSNADEVGLQAGVYTDICWQLSHLCSTMLAKDGQNIARPYSVGGNLFGHADSDDEAAGQDQNSEALVDRSS
ncbi:unnamed protein product [Symbiodinium pilosum]|uniref:Uncharacterized protein n=1 Tax=Symbiodinium pilosum TaxID=2952 RepID=A0A812W5F3_SYMPI|nr:unnamed protein product [Symbiodinium pilosum]